MKHILIVAMTLLSYCGFSQTISPDSARYYIDKEVTVCGKVTSTHVSQGESKTNKLNFGDAFPNQSFTVVIFGKDLSTFKYVPADSLKNKIICVSGKIKSYKDKPEMVISDPEKIVIQK